MITAERLAEIAVYGRDAWPMKAELIELVNAYRCDYADLERQLAAMQPMIEKAEAKAKEHQGWFTAANDHRRCDCAPCQWYRDYEARNAEMTTDRVDALGMLKKVIEDTPVTTDLKSRTVEAHKHAFTFHPVGKITDQPNAVRKCSCGLDLLDAYNELARRLEEVQQRNAAHDAELTAKAKAEALEEAINKCFDLTLYTGFDCAIALQELAAEYRAKAKGEKP